MQENIDYRKTQFSNMILPAEDISSFRLKVTSDGGETHWLDITQDELHKVMSVLFHEGSEDN